MWPFKRKQKCKHSKKPFEKYPDNMTQIIRFGEYRSDRIGHGIHQCSVCGKRVFSTIGYHMMGSSVCDRIDQFIRHEILLSELLETFKQRKYWYKLETETHQQ